MCNAATTYTSSISTNILICNLIVPPLDSSYPDSADEGYVFVRERIAPDFSGIRGREALLSFQATADCCFSCSDDSSEEDYDLTREFFMVELAEQGDGVTNDVANDTANLPVEPPANPTEPRAATPTNHAQN
jgi:hypothetical protein